MDVGLAAKALISAGAGKTISPLTSVFLYRSAASPRQPTSSNRAPSIMQRYFVFMEYPPSKQQRPAAILPVYVSRARGVMRTLNVNRQNSHRPLIMFLNQFPNRQPIVE